VLVNGYDSAETEDTARTLREQFPDTADGQVRVAGLADDIADGSIAQQLIEQAASTRSPPPYAFLASPAAGYVTGSILAVDGGYTAT